MRVNKNSETLTLLGLEHVRISRVLDVLERQLDLLENNHPVDLKLVQLAIEYFLNFPDTCHHPKEDLIFARLLVVQDTIASDLIAEHKLLSEQAHRVNQALAARSKDSDLDKNIVPSLKDFVTTYRQHIHRENTDFFPQARQLLSQHELDTIDFDLFDSSDPVFDEKTESRFSYLRNEIEAKEAG